jgi:hypothetical protein
VVIKPPVGAVYRRKTAKNGVNGRWRFAHATSIADGGKRQCLVFNQLICPNPSGGQMLM